MKKSFLIFSIALSIRVLDSANILVVLPMPWYSHTNTFMPIFKELAQRGHNITMVSPFPQKELLPNWTDITINGTAISIEVEKFVSYVMGVSVYTFYPIFWKGFTVFMEVAFQDKALQYIIKAEDLNYDLVITEPFFAQEPLVALGHKFNAPVIGIHALSLTPWQAFLSGNEISFHLVPNIRTRFTNKMSFMERLDNTLINLIEFSVAYFHYLPNKENQMNKYMVYPGSNNRPPILTMLRNVSLTLIDYHFSILYPESLQPNTIPVGGLSLSHVDPLPKDIKDIIENSENGVIFLSFGSILNRGELADKVLSELLDAFHQLEQTILMKWGYEEVPNKPKNVVVRKWLPQPSILAHPNVKLFITHAGLHGITEAAYFGVPVVCVPLFSDQVFDAKFVELVGFGTTVHLKDVTKHTLLSSINEVLKEPKYREKAVERSKILKDKPQKSLESAVYWIEYVLRHKGASHLKPARTELTLYEILGVDIILFVLFVLLIAAFILWKGIQLLYSLLFKVKIKKD